MSQRDDYEPGVPCWVDTLQPDPDGAMAFYAALFGWQFAGPGEMPGDPPGRYSVARLRGRDLAGIGSQPAGNPPPAPGWNTYVHVASADDAARRATSAGGAVLIEPFDALPAGRMACSQTRPARRSACGSRVSARAPSSSTSLRRGR
jgi:predicted enzyme related to lactoylglutathione lyase